ncbi:MAG: putative Ig domain-containing protein [Bryobacteraceae bacterium]
MHFFLRRALGCLILVCPAVQAQINCGVSLASTGQPGVLRGRAQSDLVTDFIVSCEGTPPTSGNGIQGTVTVSLNVPITSRLTDPASRASEALLLVNEPSPENQLGRPIGASVPGANVLQGVQRSTNSIEFSTVPIMPDNVSGFQRQSFRIVNIRANASLLSFGAPVEATVAINAPVSLVFPDPTVTVATVGHALNFAVRDANDIAAYSAQINSCAGNSTTLTPQTERDFLLKFEETFPNEFRERNVAASRNNPGANADQNNLGSLIGPGAESGFVNNSFPAISGMSQAGQATSGTRLVARFAGVPALAQLWVTTQPVLQGTSGTGISAVMVTTDSGPFVPVSATLGPYVRLDVVNGEARAVWEIFDANQGALESIAFGVVLHVPASSSAAGSIGIIGFHGPAATSLEPVSAPRPYFAPETATPFIAADIRACVPQLTIVTGCPLTPASSGVAYSQQLQAAGGTAPYAWSILSGALPPGITLGSTGLLSGTAGQAGNYNFALRLVDSAGATTARECSLEVRASLSITTACPLPDAGQGQPYSATLAASGGTPPYTWVIARGSLPTGLALTPGGLLAGAPTIPGPSQFTFRATDSRSLSTEKDCTLRVLAPFRLSPSSMLFRAPAGESAAPQVIHMVAQPSGQNWDARVSTFSGGEWLRATPSNGGVPGIVEVSVNTASLAPGNYEGSVTVLTRGGVQQSFGVGVRLEVTAARPPRLTAEPGGLPIAVTAGSSRADRIVTFANRGSGSIPIATSLLIDSGSGWIEAAPVSGSLGPGETMTVPLRITPGTLQPGVYRATVRAVSQSPNVEASAEAPVTLAVSAERGGMRVEPLELQFDAVAGTSPAPARVWIAATGESSVDWQSRIEPAGQALWLSLGTPAGRASTGTPSSIEVRPNTEALAPGRYRAEVTITPGGGLSPRTVLVSLNVRQLGDVPPTLIEPAMLAVNARTDGGVPRGSIALRNPSSIPVDIDFRLATESGLWNVTAPNGRSIAPGASIQLDVAADPTRLPTGVSTATLYIQTSSDSLVRPVTLVWVPSPSGRAAAPQTPQPRDVDISCPPGGIFLAPVALPYGFTAQAGSGLGVVVRAWERNGTPFETGAMTLALGESATTLQPIAPGLWGATVPIGADLGGQGVVAALRAEDRNRGITGCLALPGTITDPPSPRPSIPGGAIMSTASFAPYRPLAPGGFMAVFGSNLAAGRSAGPLPFPGDLNGTSVRVGGATVPLSFAADLGSFSQVNGVVPYTVTPNASHQVIVTAPGGATQSEVLVVPAQPGVFMANPALSRQAIAVHGLNPLLLADAANPIGPGEVIVIYCEGLGAVTPASTAGEAAPSGPLAVASAPVVVTIGGVNAPVSFAGLTPGFSGLYQVNATVPQGAPVGAEVPLVVTAGGQPSPATTIAIRP